MVFKEPVKSMCLDLLFWKDAIPYGNCTTGDRLHVEFWDAAGDHLGHQDIIEGGTPMFDHVNSFYCQQEFCWESAGEGIAAVTTWPENGPGGAWETVCVPEAPTGLLLVAGVVGLAALKRGG